MPPRKYTIQPDGLSFSRARRDKIQAPRRADEDLVDKPTVVEPEHVTKRKARERKMEKRAIATEIGLDPLADNDDTAHDELPEWISPTFTGDDHLDEENHARERMDYLIRFIAHRDSHDVRPALKDGTLDLEGLEEMYLDGADPDNEQEVSEEERDELEEDLEPAPAPTSKGRKGKGVSHKSKVGASKPVATRQAQTVYKGITFDKTSNTVAAKTTNKTGPTVQWRPPSNLDGLCMMTAAHMAATQGTPPAPLKRTDDTTWVDGRKIKDYANSESRVPRFQPQTPAPLRPNAPTDRSAQPTSRNALAARAIGTTMVPTNSTGARDPIATQQALHTPTRSEPGATLLNTPENQLTAADFVDTPRPSPQSCISKDPGDARNVSSKNPPPHQRPRTSQQPVHSSSRLHAGRDQRPMPATATASITGNGNHHAMNHSRIVVNAKSSQNLPHKPAQRSAAQQSNSTRPHPYLQTGRKPHPQPLRRPQGRQANGRLDDTREQHEPGFRGDNGPAPGIEQAQDPASEPELELNPAAEVGLDSLALVNEAANRHKAPVGGFKGPGGLLIKYFTKIAKPRVIANGIYDDSEAAMATVDVEWPREWKPRRTREQIYARCWALACAKFKAQIPLTHQLSVCVDTLVVSFCSGVKKTLKPIIDAHFGFHPARPDDNKDLCDKLLVHGFHDKDYKVKKNPFDGEYLREACKAVAFNSGVKSMGATNMTQFNNAPPPFIALVCAISHHIILGYHTGTYPENDRLSVSVQTASFRLYLQLLVDMHENQPQTLTNVRGRIHDFCWSSMSQVPVAAPRPQTPRQWDPDTDEVYVRKFGIADDQDSADEEEEDEYQYEDEDKDKDTMEYEGEQGNNELEFGGAKRRSNEQYDGGRAETSCAHSNNDMLIDD